MKKYVLEIKAEGGLIDPFFMVEWQCYESFPYALQISVEGCKYQKSSDFDWVPNYEVYG